MLHQNDALLTAVTFSKDSATILREFGVMFSSTARLTQFAGLEPFMAFLNKGRFRERWQEQFGEYRARTMLQFVLGLIVGARSMLEIGNVGRDPLVKRYVGNTVEEAQLGRDVRSFTKSQIEELHELVMSYAIFDFARSIKQTETLYFDVDATAVEKYGSQEGVEAGYIETDKIENCYQYLFFRLHNRNTIFYGTIRSGSTHSQNNFCGYLERFLPLLKARWKSVWRADSGYFSEAAFDLFSENDATFFVKAPMSESRLSLATTSPDLVWSQEKDGVSLASRVTQTARGTKYREVFKRTRLEPISLKKSQTPFRYDCVATNDLSMNDDEVFGAYNQRANVENNIRELKNDYQLGKIVTDSFDANDVITQITLLTYLLVKHFQAECLPPNLGRQQLNHLRTYLFNVPGRLLTKFGRTSFTRIQNLFASEGLYAAILGKLKTLISWVLNPPLLEEPAV